MTEFLEILDNGHSHESILFDAIRNHFGEESITRSRVGQAMC